MSKLVLEIVQEQISVEIKINETKMQNSTMCTAKLP